MSKTKVIKQVSNQILWDYKLKRTMTEEQLFNIWKEILEMECKNEIEKRIVKRTFAFISWILKIKRHWWIPTHKFNMVLIKLGFYDLTNND